MIPCENCKKEVLEGELITLKNDVDVIIVCPDCADEFDAQSDLYRDV